jgi:hypothetical protein
MTDTLSDFLKRLPTVIGETRAYEDVAAGSPETSSSN